MKTKKNREYSFKHVQERLAERYNGLEITRKEYDELCSSARSRRGDFTEELGTDTQRLMTMTHLGVDIEIVYSVKRDCITTVLPPWNVSLPK